ncbi:MAG: putative monooxygenase [Ilumatobacteraceae bacterium]|nr:putative monooxygenase [Ilumatobacteraceae bacterium]
MRELNPVKAMARLGLDRRRLKHVPGLRFWRLLGTGRGSNTGPGSDLHRTALFAVWDDDAALEAHLIRTAPRIVAADESWHVRLRALGGHGSWRGVDVLGQLVPARSTTGPVAIITRADVRPRSWRSFRQAGPMVSEELQSADGLLAVVGFGEAPIGRLGTFSLWRDIDAVRAFARQPQHLDVVRRTRDQSWYGEELFARFQPYSSSGRWDGRDPLRLPTTGSNMP